MMIKMQGVGTGRGQELEVLSSEELRKIIENSDTEDIVKLALENVVEGFKNGLAVINMETGEISGYSMENNSCNQAVDDQEILLFKFSQNICVEEEEENEEMFFTYDLLDYEEEIKMKYSEIV